MRIAVITGASSGLGVEYANAVIERYRDLNEIWLVARRKERLEKFAFKHTEIKIRPVTLDLAKNDSYDELDQLLEQEKPDIFILINNAGYEKISRLDQMDKSDIIGMIDLNVKGFTMVDRVCFPYMCEGGFVIHTSSASAFCPLPAQAVYSASKRYIKFISRALREEMRKKGVNVLALCPGNMDTEMNPIGGNSQGEKAGKLPFLNMKAIAIKSLDKASRGKAIYTPGGFYKFYRLISKILPSSVMIKIAGRRHPY